MHELHEFFVNDFSKPHRSSIFDFGAAFRANCVCIEERSARLSMETAKAVENVAEIFEAFISFLGAICDLSVDADVVIATVTEKETGPDFMLGRDGADASC